MIGTAVQLMAFLFDQDKDKKWRLEEVSEKRSLDANGYFWVLINELAKHENTSDADLHDKYLRENRAYYYNKEGALDWKVSNQTPDAYGLLRDDSKSDPQYWIDSDMRVALLKEDGTKCYNADGTETLGRVYWHIKGTHQMNRKEMSRIIDSVIVDAEAAGIPTMTPKEREKLLERWEKKHG